KMSSVLPDASEFGADAPGRRRLRGALDYSGFGRAQPAAPVIRIRRVAHSLRPSLVSVAAHRDRQSYELTRLAPAGLGTSAWSRLSHSIRSGPTRRSDLLGGDPQGVAAGTGACRQAVPSRSFAQPRPSSLRATATIACFLRVLPPCVSRWYTARAQALYRSITQAHSTKSFRNVFGPRLVIRPRWSVSVDWYCRGTK